METNTLQVCPYTRLEVDDDQSGSSKKSATIRYANNNFFDRVTFTVCFENENYWIAGERDVPNSRKFKTLKECYEDFAIAVECYGGLTVGCGGCSSSLPRPVVTFSRQVE